MERASLVDTEYHRAFLLGGRAVAADALLVCVMAGVVALNSPWDDASVYVELATCALGLLGLACAGPGAGLYINCLLYTSDAADE